MNFKPKSGLWFSPSTDNATGAGVQEPAAQPNSGEPGPQSPPAKTISFESEEKLQQHIESVLKERLERERKKADKAAQDAREQAEADAAAKNGEWQKLAETREGKIKELSAQVETIAGLQGKAERYETALKVHLATQRDGLPAHVIELLDKLDAVDQLEYIAKNRQALVGAAATQVTTRTNSAIPPTPPAGTPGQITAEQQNLARQAQRRQTLRNF